MKNLLNEKNLPILGAVCGDILGSGYEWHPTKNLNMDLCRKEDTFTDDTVCTIAVADALLNRKPFDDSLRKWCRKYNYAGYGSAFYRWFSIENGKPYNSWGNGSAMRVSAAGSMANSMEEALDLAKKSAVVTHNHPEGIKGAQATAAAIYLAKTGKSKKEIKEFLQSHFEYDLNRKFKNLQPSYSFDVSCQGSVPESIICFLESEDYEDAIRHAIAMGGDADTMAAITGTIAAAFYKEIPDKILDHCWMRLSPDIKEIILSINKK